MLIMQIAINQNVEINLLKTRGNITYILGCSDWIDCICPKSVVYLVLANTLNFVCIVRVEHINI